MSPLHRRNHGVDKLIHNSVELRAQLTETVKELEQFIADFKRQLEEQAQAEGDEDDGAGEQ